MKNKIPAILLFLFCLVWSLTLAIYHILLGKMRKRQAPENNRQNLDVICISHVEWHHAWQRNQHVMSRMALQGKVLYCYPVKLSVVRNYWKFVLRSVIRVDEKDLWLVYLLVIPGSRAVKAIERLNTFLIGGYLRALAQRHGLQNPVLWYYFPDQVDLRGTMNEVCCVYDIQDNYSHFAWASPDVAEREKRLLANADLVFTGTHALYEMNRAAAKQIEFVPCAVEFDHFHSVRERALPLPQSLPSLKKPVLGYFGLIDDRIDLKLIEELARRRPEWTFLMVGPVYASAQQIEKLPNIVFPGQAAYRDLPRYAQLFDVCLMPFVLNELTRAINPTKTLEYFALERPVVSRAIPDMVKFYSHEIDFADTADEWEAAIDRALLPNTNRVAKALAIARNNSWEATTEWFIERIRKRINELV